MGVACITDWDELAGLAGHWNALARGVPFRSWCWLAAWWRHYGQSARNARRRLFVLAAYDDDRRLIGLAPWYVESHAGGREVVRFLGSGDVCSDYLSILALPGREKEVAVALAGWLCGGSTSPDCEWSTLLLSGVDADDAVTRHFVSAIEAHGSLVLREPGQNCWRIALPATWDGYLATLSKSHRKQLRRLQRRLFDTGRATLRLVRDEADLQQGLSILADLHTRRRKALGQPGRFASRQFAAFHQDAARQLLGQGNLRLAWVEVDGRPLAAEYQVTGNDVVYAYQSGIDPSALDVEPGRLVTMATLRRAIEEGYRAFDLLRGDEPYKSHWRAQPRPSMQIRILPGRGADWLRHGAWVAGQQVRAWVKAGWSLAASLPAPT
ncbi:MAG TPA: GNAT family N-acetyltransferase [Pirellulales bacterium]|nr:GNAT family N-acetyltransferase [Pirellulales bacterium]